MSFICEWSIENEDWFDHMSTVEIEYFGPTKKNDVFSSKIYVFRLSKLDFFHSSFTNWDIEIASVLPKAILAPSFGSIDAWSHLQSTILATFFGGQFIIINCAYSLMQTRESIANVAISVEVNQPNQNCNGNLFAFESWRNENWQES